MHYALRLACDVAAVGCRTMHLDHFFIMGTFLDSKLIELARQPRWILIEATGCGMNHIIPCGVSCHHLYEARKTSMFNAPSRSMTSLATVGPGRQFTSFKGIICFLGQWQNRVRDLEVGLWESLTKE